MMEKSSSTTSLKSANVTVTPPPPPLPLPPPPPQPLGTQSQPLTSDDPFLITFTHPSAPPDPHQWSTPRKWLVTSVLSISGFNRIMVSTIMAPALPLIARDLYMTTTESVMSMSVYLLATAFGPLAIGPLPELYGRAPLLHATNIWFLGWNLVCGFANSKALLIAARVFAGLGASAIYALGGGVLSDLWRAEERGRSLGLYLLIPLLGAAVGPILGGYIAEGGSWRWIFWATSAVQGVMVGFAFVAFRETYGPVILRERARSMRKQTGDERYRTEIEVLDAGRSASGVLRNSLSRPIRMLLFHPIVQVQACLSGFAYGVLYIVLSSFSELYTSQYNESVSISGLHYIAICIGEIVGAEVTGPVMDMIFRKLKARANGSSVPEFHIPIMIPGGILAPIGMILYGWAAEKHAFWLIVDVGATILCFGMQIAGQGLQAYVIDSYPIHASSALAASQFIQSLTAFGFPLFAPSMYKALGYGWGNTLLSFVAIVVGVFAPVFVWFHGAKLRVKANSSH